MTGGLSTLGLRFPPAAAVAALAAAAVAVSSAGDGFVAVALLLVALGPRAAGAALGGVAAAVARWGTADLSVIAGDQAVLGAAVTVGPAAGALSSALAGVALLLVARPVDVPGRGERVALLVGALPCGLLAAALSAGPASTSAGDLAVRVAASAIGVAAAVFVASRRDDIPVLDSAGVAVAALAVVSAVIA